MLYQLMSAIALVVILGVSGLTAAEPVPAQEPVATSQQKDPVKTDNVLAATEDDNDESMLPGEDDDELDERVSCEGTHTFMNLDDDEEDKDDDDDMN
jgi:hypothetical protein